MDALPIGPWTEDLEKYPDSNSITIDGYNCFLRRNSNRVWCGYVELPEDHPVVQMTESEVEDKFYVHGGITFNKGNCIGFDTAHFPMDAKPGELNGHYWTRDEVVAELESLIKQL
jgi:hypothetical protein